MPSVQDTPSTVERVGEIPVSVEPHGPQHGPSHGLPRAAVSARALVQDPRVREQSNTDAAPCLVTTALSAYFGDVAIVKSVSMTIYERNVTAIIGPSGCGKSTFLRCLNRMHETAATARVDGTVTLDGQPIYGPGTNAITVRRHIGMVFQRPTSFPTMSIRDNVAAGLKAGFVTGLSKKQINDVVEEALWRAALLDEVKDRLNDSAVAMSGGQQQRLCIARALAVKPRVLLLDEPTASLDPASTQKVEELVYQLRADMTVIIVTHNMQQAARVSDQTAFLLNGDLIELAPTATLFTTPSDPRTEAYITGRFG